MSTTTTTPAPAPPTPTTPGHIPVVLHSNASRNDTAVWGASPAVKRAAKLADFTETTILQEQLSRLRQQRIRNNQMLQALDAKKCGKDYDEELLPTTAQHKKLMKLDVGRAGVFERDCLPIIVGVEFDILWASLASTALLRSLQYPQKSNNMPGIVTITRKKTLAQLLNQVRLAVPEAYAFVPKTWVLSQDARLFEQEIAYRASLESAEERARLAYIVKPTTGALGEGIALHADPEEIELKQHVVVQRYIPDPHLIDGKKYDLRVYVLLTSADPLRVYVYTDGLVRFATDSYTALTQESQQNAYMHLTNFAINKTNDAYAQNESLDDTQSGSKWTIKSWFTYMEENENADTAAVWSDICDVVTKTVVAGSPSLQSAYRTMYPTDVDGGRSFQVLGFDIMLDQSLKAWLIEVNKSPSMSIGSPLDKHVKVSMLRDVFKLVNPYAYMEQQAEFKMTKFVRGSYKQWKLEQQQIRLNAAAVREQHESKIVHETDFQCVFCASDPTDQVRFKTVLEAVALVATFNGNVVAFRREMRKRSRAKK
jgi:Tubulin-tyrosine ligase family